MNQFHLCRDQFFISIVFSKHQRTDLYSPYTAFFVQGANQRLAGILISRDMRRNAFASKYTACPPAGCITGTPASISLLVSAQYADAVLQVMLKSASLPAGQWRASRSRPARPSVGSKAFRNDEQVPASHSPVRSLIARKPPMFANASFFTHNLSIT